MKEGILKEFLERNLAEARTMSIYEYDQEEHIRLEREDAYEDGRKIGRAEGRAEGGHNKLVDLIQKKTCKRTVCGTNSRSAGRESGSCARDY